MEPDLVERIIADVDAGGRAGGAHGEVRSSDSALPLVAHMLRGLWDAGAAADRVIELREYLEHGGLMGALSRSADGALEGLAPAELQDAQRLLLGMAPQDATLASRRPSIGLMQSKVAPLAASTALPSMKA